MVDGAILVFDQTVSNRNGYYNASNGRFKSPSAGMYAFTWTICVDSRYTDSGALNYGEYGTLLINGRGVSGYLHVDTEKRFDDDCSNAFVICHVYANEYVYIRNDYAHQGRLLSKERQTRSTFSGWKLFDWYNYLHSVYQINFQVPTFLLYFDSHDKNLDKSVHKTHKTWHLSIFRKRLPRTIYLTLKTNIYL